MDAIGKSTIDLLIFLLPGLVAAEIVFSLTPSPKPAPFERVVHALILTIVVQAMIVATAESLLAIGTLGAVGRWSDNAKLLWSLLWAVALGLVVATAKNNDKVHSWLRRRGVTYQTSFSSEWYGALCQKPSYLVLHLRGERRLYGWPVEWPSTPTEGHFVLSRAEWLDDNIRIPLVSVERIMVRAVDVQMIEFMDSDSVKLEDPDGRSKATDTTPAEESIAGPDRTSKSTDDTASTAQTTTAATTAAEKVNDAT